MVDHQWNKCLNKQSHAFFVYDKDQILKNIENLRKHWAPISHQKCKLFFSVKSNPNPYLLKLLDPHIDGYDVSSTKEYELVSKLKIESSRITLSGPAKTNDLIKKFKGSHIHLDSMDEWEEFKKSSPLSSVSLRLRVGEGDWSKLGMSFEEIEGVGGKKPISGIHLYLGREAFDEESGLLILSQIHSFRKKCPQIFAPDFSVYLGPGLGNSDLYSEGIWLNPVESFDFSVNIEVGRYLLSNAGFYGAQVLANKRTDKEESLIIVNGGLQHIGANISSPRWGMEHSRVAYYRDGKKLSLSNKKGKVHGSLGIWQDELVPSHSIPDDLQRGDWILLSPNGAYGFSTASNQFVGPDPISEFLICDGEWLNVTPDNYTSYHRGGML